MAVYHVGNGIACIYAGTLNKDKSMWTRKSDVTNEAIASVFTWFTQHMKSEGEFSITYASSEYELVMRKKVDNNG